MRTCLFCCFLLYYVFTWCQTAPAHPAPGTTRSSDSIPTLFEPGVISNDGVFGFTLSPDSRTALWVQSGGKRDTLLIMESQRINGKWSSPTVASFSSPTAAWKDIDPIFSPDGKTVLFQSNRPIATMPHRKGFDIWAVNRTTRGWSQPYHLGNTINTDSSESYASIARNGNIYFMKSNENGIGSSDIYVSEFKNGEYQHPRNLGTPINTKERESNPFISPDEDYIIYFSSDPGGYGEVDLYISYRNGEGWTKPLNLGKNINSAQAEFCPFYHEQEKRLYFSRQYRQQERMIENVFSVSFDPWSVPGAPYKVSR